MRIGKFVIVHIFAAIIGIGLSTSSFATPRSAEIARKHLTENTLKDGMRELEAQIAKDGNDGEARFGLGMVQFVHAVERLGQSMYKYGLRPPRTVMVPVLRLPVPVNPKPEELTYEAFRGILQDFNNDLASAEATLAQVGAKPARIELDLARIRLNFTGSSTPASSETLSVVFKRLSDPRGGSSDLEKLEVKFDGGDAAWLRGYTHVLMAFSEFVLAHDFHTTFETSFRLFFARTVSPFTEALGVPLPTDGLARSWSDSSHIADLVGFIHTLNWPVADAAKMRASRQHLKAVIASSRESWKLILAETGDDREWVPNPAQKNTALGMQISQRQLESWHSVLDEAEAILDGKILVPHWRFAKGIDLEKFFDEPQNFDLMLFITGSGAVPFLRDGPVTSQARWTEITRAFGNSFMSYAIWIN